MRSSFILILCLLSVTGFSQTAQNGTWLPNGRVNQITRGDGKVFLGGEFNWIGEFYNGHGAILNPDLSVDSSFPPVPFTVENAISDDAGGWYTCTYGIIGHIKADKTTEVLPITFNTAGGAPVYSIAKSGNILYVCGQFTQVNSTPRANVAAIDLTTNTLTSWNPGTNGSAYAIAVFGSTVYIGGSFSTVGGLTRYKIAAVDAAGVTTAWNANVSTPFGYALKIIPTATTVYFGGSFSNVGGGSPSRRNFAAVSAATGALTTFNPRPDGIVRELLLDGTTLYIGGEFYNIGATAAYGLVSFNTTTGLINPFAVSLPDTYSGPVNSLAVDGANLYIGGDFLTINGVDKAKLAVVDKSTGVLQTTAPRNVSDRVEVVSIVGGKILMGCYALLGITGDYNTQQIAALDENTGQGVNWRAQYPAPPNGWYISDTHLEYQNDRLYYWQQLEYPLDGLTESVIGALNPADGSVISSFAVNISGVVDAWAFSGNKIYLAGDFTAINGTPHNGIAAIDLTTGALLPFTINFVPNYAGGQSINSLAVYNNVLYAAGFFDFTENGQRTNLAAWDATTGEINPWAPAITLPPFSEVRIGAVHNGKVYLIGGVAMRVNAVTGLADTWTPDYYTDLSGPGGVSSLVIGGNYVYMAGQFSTGFRRVGISSGDATTWQPDIEDVYDSEGQIEVVAVTGNKLYVGGNFGFQRADGYHRYYAQFDLPAEVPNDPPQIAASTSATTIDGIVTIDLASLISDPDDNLDLTTLVLSSEISLMGAAASLDQTTLILDYGGPFSGTDSVSIEVCDLLEACTIQNLAIAVGETTLLVYNAVSPNGDGKNEEFTLQNIPVNNKVSIFNRWGSVVFDIDNYDNQTRVFRGQSNNGSDLAPGTYYYRIDFPDGRPSQTGYLSLRK